MSNIKAHNKRMTEPVDNQKGNCHNKNNDPLDGKYHQRSK